MADFKGRRLFPLLIGCLLVLLGPPAWARRWSSVLVDKAGTHWSMEASPHRHRGQEALEIWIRKDYDPDKMRPTFERFHTQPSAYDLELWWLLPDHRLWIVEVVRYRSDDTVLESYPLLQAGAIAFPPESAMETIWDIVTETHRGCTSERTSL